MNLFNEGFKPAIDVGLSVSRIGSKVQSSALKKVSVKLRLEYAQYKELQKLTKLKAKMSEDIEQKIRRGQALTAVLIQDANLPISEIEEILIFYSFGRGDLDGKSSREIKEFQRDILSFAKKTIPEALKKLETTKELTEDITASLDEALNLYFKDKKRLK